MNRIKGGTYQIMIDEQWWTIVAFSKKNMEIKIIPDGEKIDILTDNRKTLKLCQKQ